MIPTKVFLTESYLVKNAISNYWKRQKSNKILEISEIAIPNFVGKKERNTDYKQFCNYTNFHSIASFIQRGYACSTVE